MSRGDASRPARTNEHGLVVSIHYGAGTSLTRRGDQSDVSWGPV